MALLRLFMSPSVIANIIHSNSTNKVVDLKGIVSLLGIKITLSTTIKDLCDFENIDGCPTIVLNQKLSKKEKLTYTAIAVAEYILTPERVFSGTIKYDIFFIENIYHERFTYRMLLATRLALPETVINQYCSLELGSKNILEDYDFMPQFLRCCIQDSAALFLLQNFSDLDKT